MGSSWSHALPQPFAVLTSPAPSRFVLTEKELVWVFLLLLENADSMPTESVLLSPCKRADLGAACTAAANRERRWC